MPEFFRLRFPRAFTGFVERGLMLEERASIGVADAAITVNDSLAARLFALGVPEDKVTVVRNSPDLEQFNRSRFHRRPFMADRTLRFVYAGALTPTYEVDVAIRALARVRDVRPDIALAFDVYGRGDAQDEWTSLAAD